MAVPDPLTIQLPDEAATLALGAQMAVLMNELKVFPALLLHGELGAGKTTMVRGLVETLPGGNLAEVASPSFNYMNSYPTRPECLHFDLYRLRDHGVDDELLEAMHEADRLILIEWAEFCPETFYPQDRLHCRLTVSPVGREATLAGFGGNALRILEHVRNWERSFG